MKRLLILFILSSLLLAGCVMGPNYKRPLVPTPPTFRGADQSTAANSLADTKWPDLFQDPVLTDLVTTALTRNYDMRIAAERVLQARAQYGITRSDVFPTVEVAAGFSANRNLATTSAIPNSASDSAGSSTSGAAFVD
jgi:outer membrane protein TolC